MQINPAMAAGLILTLLGWIVARLEAGAPLRVTPSAGLDVVVPVVGFLVIGMTFGRPIFAGAITGALCAGFAGADYCKRRAFGEPVLVADFFSTLDIIRHPQICLIFPRPLLLVACVTGVIGSIAGLFALETPSLRSPFWLGLVILLAGLGCAWLVSNPLLQTVAAYLNRLALTGRPRRDARQVGSFAMLITYALLARAQRAERRFAVAPRAAAPAHVAAAAPASPIVLVQSESFFDPRRLHAGVAQELLAAYDLCRAQSLQWGRFGVPAWGANTERTEFAALTGLPAKAAGFDRFNPYHQFARQPVASLAWRLRADGYRTICIHPFDRTFYGRDKVLPQLGFDEFLGQEAFPDAAREGAYIGDVDVADLIIKLLASSGPKTFIFVITMENHAPWSKTPDFERDFAPGLPAIKDGAALRNYLSGVANADKMIAMLTKALRARGDDGMLGFYGDHLPNLTGVFADLGFRSRRSDYLIWRAHGGSGRRQDLAAHHLADEIWRAHRRRSEPPLVRGSAPPVMNDFDAVLPVYGGPAFEGRSRS